MPLKPWWMASRSRGIGSAGPRSTPPPRALRRLRLVRHRLPGCRRETESGRSERVLSIRELPARAPLRWRIGPSRAVRPHLHAGAKGASSGDVYPAGGFPEIWACNKPGFARLWSPSRQRWPPNSKIVTPIPESCPAKRETRCPSTYSSGTSLASGFRYRTLPGRKAGQAALDGVAESACMAMAPLLSFVPVSTRLRYPVWPK
jgi:hypothetical protein